MAELCNLVEKSDNSIYAYSTTDEISQLLKKMMGDFSQTGSFNREKLDVLLAPTGSIQEISIDNHWGEKFLQLAQEIDELSRQL